LALCTAENVIAFIYLTGRVENVLLIEKCITEIFRLGKVLEKKKDFFG